MTAVIRRAMTSNAPFYGAALISLVGGVVRTKVIAEGLGVAGTGYIGQLSTAVAVLGLIAFLSLWSVSARDLSAEMGSGQNPIRTASILIVVAGSNFFVGVLLVLPALFGVDTNSIAPNSWGTAGLIVLAVASSWMNAAMVWWRVYHSVFACLFATLVGNAASIFLSWYGGEKNDIRYVEVGLLCTFAIPGVVFFGLSVVPWIIKNGSRFNFSTSVIVQQVRDGIYSMSSSLSRVGADLASRAIILGSLGSVENGLIQPYYMYSGVLITQFISISQTSIIGDAVRRDSKALLKRLMLVFLSLLVGAVFVTVFGEFILRVLFSDKFAESYPSFAAGTWAEVGRWVGITVCGILVVHDKMRLVALLGIVGAGIRVLVVHLGCGNLGLMSVPYSVVLETLVVAVLLVSLAYKELGRGVSGVVGLSAAASFVGVTVIGGSVL